MKHPHDMGWGDIAKWILFLLALPFIFAFMSQLPVEWFVYRG